MSPEISFFTNHHGLEPGHKVVADVPDESGTYSTPLGGLEIDMRGIDRRRGGPQTVFLKGDFLKGMQRGDGSYGPTERTVHLSHKGRGSQMIDSATQLVVKLHEPIRETHFYRR